MNEIENLQRRFNTVMERFRQTDEVESQQAERLTHAVGSIADWLHQMRADLARAKERNEELASQNESLRIMLHSLLMAVESKNRSTMAKTMIELESRMASLTQGAEAAGLPAPEMPVEAAGEDTPLDLDKAAPAQIGTEHATTLDGADDLDIPQTLEQSPAYPPPPPREDGPANPPPFPPDFQGEESEEERRRRDDEELP